jgi:hypothetical protein
LIFLTKPPKRVDNRTVRHTCRIKPIAPPTLVALALVMAAGAPLEAMPRVTPVTAVEHARVLREDRDGEQVARLIAAINSAAEKVQPRAASPAMAMHDAPAAMAATPWLPPHIFTDLPAAHQTDGKLHLLDLPPPALRA